MYQYSVSIFQKDRAGKLNKDDLAKLTDKNVNITIIKEVRKLH